MPQTIQVIPAELIKEQQALSLRQVLPIARGQRVCSFFWLQSMIREDAQRSLLFDLDTSIQQVNQIMGAGHATSVQLTGVYHNLLRRWAK